MGLWTCYRKSNNAECGYKTKQDSEVMGIFPMLREAPDIAGSNIVGMNLPR